MGKCVVIGLQSTGEARTMEALEREEELTDFVSTAKGVLQVGRAYNIIQLEATKKIFGGAAFLSNALLLLEFTS